MMAEIQFNSVIVLKYNPFDLNYRYLKYIRLQLIYLKLS